MCVWGSGGGGGSKTGPIDLLAVTYWAQALYLCLSQKNLLVCDYRLLLNVMGTVSFDYLEGKEGGKREESIESR